MNSHLLLSDKRNTQTPYGELSVTLSVYYLPVKKFET